MLLIFSLIIPESRAQVLSIYGGDSFGEIGTIYRGKDSDIKKRGYVLTFPGNKSLTTSEYLDFNNKSTHGAYLNVTPASSQLNTFDNSGALLSSLEFETITSEDKTVTVYQLDHHHSMVRSNVAQFEIYNNQGRFVTTISNSQNTDEGEKLSQASIATNGQSFVLYNPVVFNKKGQATTATLIYLTTKKQLNLYFEQGYETANIQFDTHYEVWIATLNKIGEDKGKVLIYNNLGMELAKLDVDIDVIGATLSSDFSSVTVYSSGRMQLYSLKNGERLGSSSVRGNPLFFAFYHPAKNYIVGLTAMQIDDRLQNITATVVDLSKRKINSIKSDSELTLLLNRGLYLELNGKSGYVLKGGYKPLYIKF